MIYLSTRKYTFLGRHWPETETNRENAQIADLHNPDSWWREVGHQPPGVFLGHVTIIAGATTDIKQKSCMGRWWRVWAILPKEPPEFFMTSVSLRQVETETVSIADNRGSDFCTSSIIDQFILWLTIIWLDSNSTQGDYFRINTLWFRI